MEFNELVDAFASKYGIEGLSIKDGIAAMSIDGMNCAIVDDAAEDCVTVCGEIGRPPLHANGPFGELMLKANYFLEGSDGSVFSINPETGAYSVFRKIPRPAADLDALSAAVEKVSNQMSDWKNILNGVNVAEEKAAESESISNSNFNPLSGGGFMQV